MKKIIILHGWTKNLDKWQPFIDTLRKKGISISFPKIPGLTEDLEKAWDLLDYVTWLKNIVDKARPPATLPNQSKTKCTSVAGEVGREKDKVVLIGHSNGGRIALAFANLYPEKLKKLILIDSAGIYHNELLHKIKISVFRKLAKIGKKITSSKILEDLLYKLAREGDYRKSSPIMKQTMINLLNSDKDQNLSKISIPTLIIWGKEDKITPLADGKLMHNLIKNSELKIIDNARHGPMFTHPQKIAETIYEYL